jgi:hypothetical protein
MRAMTYEAQLTWLEAQLRFERMNADCADNDTTVMLLSIAESVKAARDHQDCMAEKALCR